MFNINKKKIKKFISIIREKNPIEVRISNPKFDLEEENDKTFLALVDGQDTVTKEVNREPDDLTLEYEGKECVIASKPLNIHGNRLYFSKHGLQTTVPLNKATMIGADVYIPSKENIEFTLPDNVALDDLEIDSSKFNKKNEDTYQLPISSEETGQVGSVRGSKQTLKEQNKAKRSRKLLKPSGLDTQTLLLAVGSGVAVGFMIKGYMG